MRVQDKGAYGKYTDVSGKLYIPFARTNMTKRPCKRLFTRATEAKDYGFVVSDRYERLKAYARNQGEIK